MSNNRHETYHQNLTPVTEQESEANQHHLGAFINESRHDTLVRGPIRILKGLKPFQIMDGKAAVVFDNGRATEVLTAGRFYRWSFPLTNRIYLYIVDVRERLLDIRSEQELTLFHRMQGQLTPLPVDLELSIVYQVIDPIFLLRHVQHPVTQLFDKVYTILKTTIAALSYEEFQTHHFQAYLNQELDQCTTEKELGIKIKRLDIRKTGGTVLFDQHLREAQQELQRAQIAEQIATTFRQNPDGLLIFNPTQYAMLYGERKEIVMQIVDLLKEALRNNPTLLSTDTTILHSLLNSMSPGYIPNNDVPSINVTRVPSDNPTLYSIIGAERLAIEVQQLQTYYDSAELAEDSTKAYYYVHIVHRDAKQQTIKLSFMCTHTYPQEAPALHIVVNNREETYTPDVLHHWTPACTLHQVANKVITAYGHTDEEEHYV